MRLLWWFAALAAVSAAPDNAALEASLDANLDLVKKFKEFVEFFVKEYESVSEMLHRMSVFHANLKNLEKAKAKDKTGKYSHLTPFMDKTPEEFKALNTLKAKERAQHQPAKLLSTANLPSSYDWRKHGAVNAVKDQKQCGSCWAFGTVANIEGAQVVQGGLPLISLSEQELVDCSQSDNGCDGGLPDRAFTDLIQGKVGMNLESDYGYHAREGRCQVKQHPQKAFIDSFEDISQDEDQIAAALIKYGPLVIGINAEPMQFYSGGISDPDDCDPSGIDHAVNIVGFGEEDGKKYWIIRNSWGSWWGEHGYYRIVRGVGRCGLNQMVSTAVVNKKDSEIVV